MSRYFAQRPFVSFTVFIVACVGSILLVDKQLSRPPVAVIAVPRRPEVFISSKFTRVGRVPTAEGPPYQMHFINSEDGWLTKGKHLWHTQTGGKTWELVYEIPPGSDSQFANVQFVDSKLVVAREEPQELNDIFTAADRLVYKGHEVRKFTKKVPSDIGSEVEVSYAMLMKNKRRLLEFDGVYFGRGNDTQFGLFGLLGQGSKQIIISQTVPRGGRHWVVSVSPTVRVLFDSGDYGVGREEFYVIDIDKDGVYEIVLPVTAFYAMQDKMYIGEIPLPEIIFKYDAKARRYLPANHRFVDYALHGIERDMYRLRNDGHSNYLSRRLKILLRYIYAKQAAEGWASFFSLYDRPDQDEIVARIGAVLKDDPVYNYLYSASP